MNERRLDSSETALLDLVPSPIRTEDSRGSDTLVLAVLAGRAQPHELPGLLHALWRDGFHAGQAAARRKIDAANRDADYWYFVANNPREASAERDRMLREFQVTANRRAVAQRWAELDRIAERRLQQRAG